MLYSILFAHICAIIVQLLNMIGKNKITELEEINLTKADFDKIKSFLPLNYIELIINRLDHSVSERTIKYVLSGTRHDHKNIIETALDIAFEVIEKRKELANRISQLK